MRNASKQEVRPPSTCCSDARDFFSYSGRCREDKKIFWECMLYEMITGFLISVTKWHQTGSPIANKSEHFCWQGLTLFHDNVRNHFYGQSQKFLTKLGKSDLYATSNFLDINDLLFYSNNHVHLYFEGLKLS